MVNVLGAQSTRLSSARFCFSQLFLTGQFSEQVGGDYTVKPGPDSGPRNPGVPIHELIETGVGIPSSTVELATIKPAPSPAGSTLSSVTHDFDPPATNQFEQNCTGTPTTCTHLQPIFYPVGNASIAYIRPLHADDASDQNSGDDLQQVSPGLAFTIDLYTSLHVLLHPIIKATAPNPMRPGNTVHLSGTVADPNVRETFDWTWHLEDGEDVDTHAVPALDHRYTEAGRYSVQVTVTGSAGGQGVSNTVVVTVTAEKPGPTQPRTTGPGRGAGASTNPIGGPSTGNGGRYNGRPGAPPTAAGAPTTATVTGSRTAPAATAAGAARLRRPTGGAVVAGFALVDSAGASAAGKPVDAPAAPAPAIAARAGGAYVRASLAWVGAACILALLLAGAGLERRRAFPGARYGRKRWRHR